MKILLTDGSHMNTLGMMRHLKGHEIDIIHHKKSAPAYSRYCNRLVLSPEVTDFENYFSFLHNHVKNNRYDIIIPVGVLSSYICSKYYKELSEYVRIEIAAFKNFQVAIDKAETYRFCERHGILHPKTYDNLDDVQFPAVIKTTGEVIGKFPVKYINDRYELDRQMEIIEKDFPSLRREDLVIQDCIEGEPYGFFCLYQNGVLKRALCQRRIREYPATGGPATSAKTIYDEKLIEAGKQVFDKLNWHGVGMVEYKKDREGNFYVIEINPKFWTALEMHIVAGMHFPEYLLQMGDGELEYSDRYKKISFVWIFAPEAELYRLFERPRDIFKVIRDIFRSKTDLHLDDIKPTIIQFFYWLVWVFKRKPQRKNDPGMNRILTSK